MSTLGTDNTGDDALRTQASPTCIVAGPGGSIVQVGGKSSVATSCARLESNSMEMMT